MSQAMQVSFRLIVLLGLLSLAVPSAEAQEYLWAKQVTSTDPVQAFNVALDSSGNVYAVGRFEGTADFDPGAGTANLTSAGDKDMFVLKLDSDGNYIWALQLGGTGNDRGRGVVVDDFGNIYVTGYFTGTADVDPGPGTFNLVSAGSEDTFVVKLDPAANLVWASQASDTSQIQPFAITLDDSGNVCTTGLFKETADFDPGPGTASLTSAGGWDSFTWKLDASGNHVWAAQVAGTGNNIAYDMATDADGSVYAGGYFAGTADFDPGAGTANLTSGAAADAFVWKLDSAGNFLWARQLNGPLHARVRGLALDGGGNVYAAGFFGGTVDFDPGAGTLNLTAAANDTFVVKLDSDGELGWARQLGGPDNDSAWDVGVDGDHVYTVGHFRGTADFDPGSGSFPLTSADDSDIFVSRLDAAGDFLSVLQIGGALADFVFRLALDSSGSIHMVGYFEGTSDFDPGAGTAMLTATGQDAFVARLRSVTDFDGDGILNEVDNCPETDNPAQLDWDGDGVGDVCDNCPDTINPDQADVNGNGSGNVCDPSSIPTVSEWGMIFMTLLFLTFGTIAVTRRELIFAGGEAVGIPKESSPRLFEPGLFVVALIGTAALLAIGSLAVKWLSLGPTRVDIVGASICAPLLAYLVHLWLVLGRDQ